LYKKRKRKLKTTPSKEYEGEGEGRSKPASRMRGSVEQRKGILGSNGIEYEACVR